MSAPAAGGAEPLRLRVEGMTCASCSARIQRVLERQPGVVAASVRHAAGTASVVAPGVDPAVLVAVPGAARPT